jgi:opacity protein-like surface antigen
METSGRKLRTHSMRPLLLLVLGATSAFSQPFSFGVKGGVPLTDFIDAATSTNQTNGIFGFATHTNRYIVGATGELRLPFGLGVEVDALYRHLDYQSSLQTSTTTTSSSTTANAFEFPVLVKYRFGPKVIHPFVDGGVAWDTLQGLTQDIKNTLFGATGTSSSSSSPSQLANNTTRGYVVGGGLDFKFLIIHIQPEVRYTRWGAKHFFDPSGLLNSNQNQAEFLLGVTF